MGLVHVDHFDVRGPTFPSSWDIAQDFQSLCHGIVCTLCYCRNDEFSLNLAPDPRFARPCFRSWGIRGNAGGICHLLPPRTWPKVGVQCWASGCDWGLWIHRLSHSSGAVEG